MITTIQGSGPQADALYGISKFASGLFEKNEPASPAMVNTNALDIICTVAELWDSVKDFSSALFNDLANFRFPSAKATEDRGSVGLRDSSRIFHSMIRERETIEESPSQSRELQIPELSRTLLVSEEKLRAKLDEGVEAFDAYVSKKQLKYSEVLEQARADYEEVFANYEVAANGSLSPKGVGHAVQGLTKDLLMKIVRHSALQLANIQDDDQQGAEISMKNYPNWHLLAKRENGSLYIAKWCGEISIPEAHGSYLGRGAFGIVHKVEDVAHGRFAAFKFALARTPEEQGKAEEDAEGEVVKLRRIHEGGSKAGLQEAPYAFFNITGSGPGRRIVGYMQKLYNKGDLIERVIEGTISPETFTKRTGLLMMKELFTGLKTLHTKTQEEGATIHGDIKPDNIFVERLADGSYSFVIADLGDAKNTKHEMTLANKANLKNMNVGLGTVASPGFFTDSDIDLLLLALVDGEEEKWTGLQEKRDIFATASSIWQALAGGRPYPLIPGCVTPFVTGSPLDMSAFTAKYGQEVANIMAAALKENPTSRPTIDEILAVIDGNL